MIRGPFIKLLGVFMAFGSLSAIPKFGIFLGGHSGVSLGSGTDRSKNYSKTLLSICAFYFDTK